MSTGNLKLSNKDYSNFGRYVVKDGLEISLPNNDMICSPLNKDTFSYKRKNSESAIKKIIQPRSSDFEIGIMPILPVHVPSYKTDFFFMRFDEEVYVSQNAAVETDILFPIEIGVFLVEQERAGLIDCFSCDPDNARYALYGPPENGRLCKYAYMSFEKHDTHQPFVHAHMKLRITNELDDGAMVRKIVFPVTDHGLYYHHSDVIMDGLGVTIKNRLGIKVAETVQSQISGIEGWHTAIRDTQKTDYRFSMEGGFD